MNTITNFLIGVVLFALQSTAFAQTVNVTPSNTKIQYSGRMTMKNPDAPVFSLPSTSIKINFNGTSVKGTFSNTLGNSFLYIIVDGNADPYNREVIKITAKNQVFTLVENLDAGDHTLEIVKVNEYDTKVTFKGFVIKNGTGLLPPSARPALKIEYYGDSNAAGWSAWDVRDEGYARLSGGYYTYPAMTARMLNAEVSNFSAGGHGVTDAARKLDLKDHYSKIHITGGNSNVNQWDFENNYWGFTADVVVINLGANDYYSGASETVMKSSWNELVTTLRTHYPAAHIVMANSKGWAFGEPADYVGDFVAERIANGDTNMSFVKFPWYWSDYHTVINEHAGFANILAAHIANVMNLPTPTPSNLSTFAPYGEVGNGSFESSLIEGFADGWRPFATWSFPEYAKNRTDAVDGTCYLVCPPTFGVMHAAPANPGDMFDLSVYARAQSGTRGRLKYEFRNQGQAVIEEGSIDILDLNSDWKQISLTTIAAPEGTWHINVILEALNNSTINFDLAEMQLVTSNGRNSLLKKDLNQKLKYTVYPNPSVDRIQFEIEGLKNEVPNYTIFNVQGVQQMKGKGTEIEIVTLPKGVYFIQVEGYSTVLTFIKK
ncbi:T9SS type A sorting domain-containing protein [Flammeovirga pectinis]|uniref:T9SS type A sorting domain-containing protein n=1 Tax=Flammeovirga pectinis TaxID=2494373 RepID=A0A3Q9FM61_9BACT|nr:GDSL-type esterase/lipase family protein [Flammeovirga pectinis]AZQ61412.1 T9SS type A sorting domain-containing protein [Flammeovirga pectinis]